MSYRPLLCVTALSLTIAGGLLSRAHLPAGETAPGASAESSADWPCWRGPNRNGIAQPQPSLPVAWGAKENLRWQAEIPGRGHASPIVVGDQVLLPSADDQAEIQWVISYDRDTGRERWRTVAHQGKFDKRGNRKSSQASGSLASDGERVYANFVNDGAVQATALSLDGKILWQRKVAEFDTHQGFGASPGLWNGLVYFVADSKAGGAIVALEGATGKEVWRQGRPKKPNYTSPIVLTIDGRNQLALAGCDLVSSFEPMTGEKLWEINGSTTECVGTIVTDGERVFCSGGYPKNHTMAVEADGSGKVAWQNNTRLYVPSMLAYEGHVYCVTDAGVAICYKSDTGEEVWKGRTSGKFSGSPTLAGGNLFVTSESGVTTIIKATPEKFELLGENQLGSESFASPVICGGRIYLRAAETTGGGRQEMLYCIESK